MDIRIQNARSHNLVDVSCRIPLGSLTVVSGVSGSGKSTLAFDTLYAEGQRRYVSSLTAYARQFLERLPRPDVDFISNLPPAIAIERRNRVTSARSTVGTATEIHDFLRLLFAKIGETWCADCERRVLPGTVETIVNAVVERFGGQRVSIVAPLPPARGEAAAALRDRLLREGFTRLLGPDGAVAELSELPARELARRRGESWLLIDRLVPRAGEGQARLADAVASAFARGHGRCGVVAEGGVRAIFHEGFACDGCGRAYPLPEPALFSFNSPLGACEVCQGFGRTPELDRDRVVPDPNRSIDGLALAPFATPSGQRVLRKLQKACALAGVPTDRPFGELSEDQKDWVFRGDGRHWRGVQGFFERLERKRYKVQARVMIARYRRFVTCEGCGGARLRPEALSVRVGGRSIAEVCRGTLGELCEWLEALELAPGPRERAGRLLADLRARAGTTAEVGLGYMTLDRPMRTLSGGEAQRIQLATALGGVLTASLYVLDEPSIGLHARDSAQLVAVLERVRDQGNTVVVVEHAPEIVAAADHVIDLGPRGGRRGGRLVFEGSVAELREHPDSLTARALRGEFRLRTRPPRPRQGILKIVGAREHNLQGVTVEIPLRQLVVVSGVSGAGKSTLIGSVLVGHLNRDPERGACDRVEGGAWLSEVVVVEPSAPARSSRSNPATVSKAFDGIRRRFAETREARRLGLPAGWFSFNVKGGRCEACEGAGEVVVDMQFLDDVRMPCEACEGKRYRPEAAEVRVAGRNIVETLALTVDEALEVFANDSAVAPRLQPLADVGLGYLAIGQPLSTLSGGELQRLRIAPALGAGETHALYVLDEPTTGLHPADVELLLASLDRILDAGGSVIVIEHNLDVIRRADHVIDLGPEAGPGGGRIVAQGPPAAIAACATSLTGAALRAAALPVD
ncbi:MAG: excinuclease ABC subunit UvrA [Candidatus Limnocylindria bacterium]